MGGFDVASLTIEQKIGQLFFIGIPGPDFDDQTERLLSYISPGGVCLFSRNIKDRGQTRDLLDSIFEHLPVPAFLSLDQEGGRVDRLRRVLTPMPSASHLKTPEDARELGSIIGEALSLLGFNMDFAPVVDVIEGTRKELINGLQNRGFGNSKTDVAEFADAFLASLSDFGILGCLKHFPGLAAAEVDSHEELPIVSARESELTETDLYPYTELLPRYRSVSVMVAHAAYPNTDLQELDSSGKLLPSSLNKRIVTNLLRDELNFTGVAITDDLEMGAILKNYGIEEACKMAVNAGQDMLAICADPKVIERGFESVKGAVRSGEISEERVNESVHRIADLKSKIPARKEFDDVQLAGLNDRIRLLTDRLN